MNKTPYYFCMNPFPSSTGGDADSGMYYIWLKDSQNKWYRICRVGLNGGYESYDRELPDAYKNLTFKGYAQLHNS